MGFFSHPCAWQKVREACRWKANSSTQDAALRTRVEAMGWGVESGGWGWVGGQAEQQLLSRVMPHRHHFARELFCFISSFFFSVASEVHLSIFHIYVFFSSPSFSFSVSPLSFIFKHINYLNYRAYFVNNIFMFLSQFTWDMCSTSCCECC